MTEQMSEPSFGGEGREAPQVGQQQQYPCAACGARLEFAAGTTALSCPYCGHQQEVVVAAEQVVREHSFAGWLNSADKPTGHVGAYGVHCSGCGARTETDKLSDACPFCGAAIVLEPDAEAMITPEAVLPFGIPQDKALESFREWINSRWFAPTSLKTLAAHEGIQGTYLPHWTFDSDTTTMYRGQRGDYYYTTESYTDSDGKRQTRQVRHVRWYPAYGSVQRVFDDILVPAVTSLPADKLTELEPWDMPQVTPYRAEYLAGFQTLRYQVEPPEGFDLFKQSVHSTIEDDCRNDIGGDEQRLSTTETDWGEVTFKLLLLPAWLAAYRYRDRAWRVMINARTGEVIGERPYSAWKIAGAVLAVLTVLAVALAIYLLNRPAG
jgi:DNA-directed RNA polymerase subunit RPC12/RpoP